MSKKQSVVHSLVPVVPVKDVKEAADFYVEKLGFTEEFIWDEGEGPSYAVVSLNDAYAVHLAHREKKFTPAIIYAFCEHIEGVFKRVKGTGATITAELTEHPWGMKEFAVEDPSGNHIVFGEPAQE